MQRARWRPISHRTPLCDLLLTPSRLGLLQLLHNIDAQQGVQPIVV
jgi:hypothetical protein